jgi:hypothetical protein
MVTTALDPLQHFQTLDGRRLGKHLLFKRVSMPASTMNAYACKVWLLWCHGAQEWIGFIHP